MPYNNISDLPQNVKEHLPEEAQKIFLEAYDHAWDEYADPQKRRNGASREETAMKVAWSAVKNKYEKDSGGIWKKK